MISRSMLNDIMSMNIYSINDNYEIHFCDFIILYNNITEKTTTLKNEKYKMLITKHHDYVMMDIKEFGTFVEICLKIDDVNNKAVVKYHSIIDEDELGEYEVIINNRFSKTKRAERN